MKIAITFLIALGFYSPVRELPDRNYILSEVDNVVALQTDVGRCSGTIISSTRLLTAAHCVAGLNSIVMAKFDDGYEGAFMAVYVGTPGSSNDIAILEGDTHDASPARLASKLELPSTAFFFGFAGTETEMMFPGFLFDDQGEVGIFGVAEVRPGDSGGPVFGKDGKLIGVIWGKMIDDDFSAIIAPVDNVHKALSTLK